MLLNGFQLEILVNGSSLEEYTLPINDSRSTTGPSYVLDEMTGQYVYSDVATYVAVKPEARYSIRFSSTRSSMWAPLMACVYVDGEFDYIHQEITSSAPQILYYFLNSSLGKKYYFKFETSQLSEIGNLGLPLQRKPHGGIGAISIYFYKAIIIPRKQVYVPNFSINQAQIAESKSTYDIKFTTAFDEAEDFVSWQAVTTMEKQSNDPVAVLHLHYRPATWLSIRGCNVPEIDLPNLLSGLSSDVRPYSFDIKDIKGIKEEGSQSRPMRKPKYKIIRAPVVCSGNIIEITDEDESSNSNEVIDLENYTPKIKKRKYTKEVDVIKLLDSDEEDEEENSSKIICID